MNPCVSESLPYDGYGYARSVLDKARHILRLNFPRHVHVLRRLGDVAPLLSLRQGRRKVQHLRDRLKPELHNDELGFVEAESGTTEQRPKVRTESSQLLVNLHGSRDMIEEALLELYSIRRSKSEFYEGLPSSYWSSSASVIILRWFVFTILHANASRASYMDRV